MQSKIHIKIVQLLGFYDSIPHMVVIFIKANTKHNKITRKALQVFVTPF